MFTDWEDFFYGAVAGMIGAFLVIVVLAHLIGPVTWNGMTRTEMQYEICELRDQLGRQSALDCISEGDYQNHPSRQQGR